MKIKAVIFDFDGPINDSFREGLRRIEVLAGMNQVEFNRTKRQNLIKLWGKPGVDLLQAGLEIERELAEKIYPQWEVWDLVDPIPLIPGAREVLRGNRKRKILNTLLTSRNHKNILDIFDKLDLMDEFAIIQTGQHGLFRKPDLRVFWYTLDRLWGEFRVTREECIFVGDTPEDILCGKQAQIETLIVMTGPYWLEHILTYPVKPQNVIPSVDYLSEWIEKNSY